MAVLKDSLITGDLRVTGTIYGLTTNSNQVLDYNDNKPTKFGYSTSDMTTASWIGAWDNSVSGEYRLKAISPANLKTTMALNNVENTKLSTWTGSSNITTIGTLSSGTVPWARLSNVPSASTSAAGIIQIGTGSTNAAAGNHNHDSIYVNVSGDTMTGQLKTSFKSSVAMGTYQAAATTIPNLCEELRYSSGVAGSANITTAYTKDNVTIGTGWYNFLWMPHRSGGVNGAASGDNCNFGSLYLSGMTMSGAYMIRYSSQAIAEVRNLYKPIISNHSYTPAGTVSQPTFTGNALTSTGKFTPAGTNSAPAFTGTAATIVVSGGSGTATYTPAGTITVNTAGSTVAADDITAWTTNTPTAVTKKTVVVSTSATTVSVSNEVLTIPASVLTGSTTGDSVSVTAGTAATLTYTARTVKSGDASYKFTGTGTRLTASYTPAGSVAAPTFTGTQGNLSVSGTPSGTVSKPTFSGTAATLSHTIS